MRSQRKRRFGHLHHASTPVEELAPEPLLHFGDLRRQRRLAHARQFRGTAEMQRLGQRIEIGQLSQGG